VPTQLYGARHRVELSGGKGSSLKQAFRSPTDGVKVSIYTVARTAVSLRIVFPHHFAPACFPVGYRLYSAVRFQQGLRHGIAILQPPPYFSALPSLEACVKSDIGLPLLIKSPPFKSDA